MITHEGDRRALVIQYAKSWKITEEAVLSFWRQFGLEYPMPERIGRFFSQPSHIFEGFVRDENSMIIEEDSDVNLFS